jgi:hypothetical protein
LPFVPEFFADLSAPPDFSGGVPEKYLSTGWARTFNLQITNQKSAIAPRHARVRKRCHIHSVTFLAFRPYL